MWPRVTTCSLKGQLKFLSICTWENIPEALGKLMKLNLTPPHTHTYKHQFLSGSMQTDQEDLIPSYKLILAPSVCQALCNKLRAQKGVIELGPSGVQPAVESDSKWIVPVSEEMGEREEAPGLHSCCGERPLTQEEWSQFEKQGGRPGKATDNNVCWDHKCFPTSGAQPTAGVRLSEVLSFKVWGSNPTSATCLLCDSEASIELL